MLIIRNLKIIVFSVGIILPLVIMPKLNAGSFGAEIFCTMREGGNDHESSWDAAYTYIKKQKGGFFKTSPYQAASQIIETVVREKEKFSYCVEYLDNLYPDRKAQREQMRKERKRKRDEIEKEKKRKEIENMIDEENNNFSNESFDRYSY
tara:strand:- start:138 stop:587 length:450 start_codon:yes stop_codon:yes gene_type:complete